MKNGLIIGLAFIFVLGAAGAFAAPPVGGPAEVAPGQWGFSAGYFYSQDKWSSNTLGGGRLPDFEPKVVSNTYFGQFAYGLAPGWDVYLRAGAIDAELKDSDANWKSNPQFFGGVGMHGRLFEKKDWHLAFGPAADFAYFANWGDRSSFQNGNLSVKMTDHYSFNVGFGFQYTPAPYVTFYGGPFYHYETAKLETFGNVVVGGQNIRIDDSSNISPSSSFGGRFGARIPLTKSISFQVEAQFRDYVSGGGWLTYGF
jgi:hypothetical protein